MIGDFTAIAVVLDRSGSMGSCRDATIDGFNEFVRGQRAVPGKCALTLVQFDFPSSIDTLYSMRDIREAALLNYDTYLPRGNTALLDAMGLTIESFGRTLAAIPEKHRPGKVLFVTITDGMENASTRFTRTRVFDAVTHQREKYRWEFLYLGANQDAITEGMSLGIQFNNVANYRADHAGTRQVFAAAATSAQAYRSSGLVRDPKLDLQDVEGNDTPAAAPKAQPPAQQPAQDDWQSSAQANSHAGKDRGK